jgi:hypothetical protein
MRLSKKRIVVMAAVIGGAVAVFSVVGTGGPRAGGTTATTTTTTTTTTIPNSGANVPNTPNSTPANNGEVNPDTGGAGTLPYTPIPASSRGVSGPGVYAPTGQAAEPLTLEQIQDATPLPNPGTGSSSTETTPSLDSSQGSPTTTTEP